ncbi:MAG TPA: HGxxPAAW family protein [Jiangellaceae bacterium]
MASRADHGHTTAAWTTVLIILAGIFLGAFAVVLLNWPLFYISIGVIVLGGIVGKVLQMAGLGKKTPEVTTTGSARDVGDTHGGDPNDPSDPVESSTP